MNALLQWDGFDVWQLAGWTMLHFLWLGALVAIGAIFGRWLLRRRSPELRYAIAIGCLILLASMPAAIVVWQLRNSLPLQGGAGQGFPAAQQTANSNIVKLAETTALPLAPGSARLSSPKSAGGSLGGIAPINESGATGSASAPTDAPNSFTDWNSQRQLAASTIYVIVRYLPWLWLVGTPLTFLLTASGVIGAERLRRSSRLIESGPIVEACARLAKTLRIGRRVTVAICERIAAPVLVGIVRPIILLPPAALTGWSPEEIEMVLVHELAHVRRWDNLVNLAQRLIEAVLFFHPAVWLISNWIRREREACCDATVVARTNRPHAYAELLVALAAQLPRSVLFHPAASSAMAAGPLRSRIRCILQLEDDPMLISGKSLGVVMSSLLLAATLVVLNLPTRSQAEESTSEKKDLTTNGTEATEKGIEAFGDANERQIQMAATQNNLKSLVIALHNYQAARKRFPPSAKFDASGKPLLSWRVLVLPYLDPTEAKLYEEFHLDEPWDSEHNHKLVARMPKVFQNPRIDRTGMTNYLAVVGKDCIFDGTPKGIGISQIRDGTSRTIALVEADADRAVEWTKPQDWNFDSNAPTAGLGSFWPRRWFAAWADGSVNAVDNSEPVEKIRELFTCGRERATNLQVYGDFEPSAVDGEMGMAGGEMESLVSTDGDAATTFGLEDQELTQVPFVQGATRFADGDNITINEVRGTAAIFEPGNVYWIKGTYTLESRDRAALSAFTTAKHAANAMGPIRKNQTTIIKRGSGTFTLRLPMSSQGWPHVSFYPADGGEGFGGVYFGTDDSVLKKWWGSKEAERDSVSSPYALPTRFPSLDDQKLADFAYRQMGLELEPIGADDLKRVQATSYDGGVKVSAIAGNPGGILPGDILVGIHVWPTTSLKDVAGVLRRDDLAELNPLKFYVVRREADGSFGGGGRGGVHPEGKDTVLSGRISVSLQDRPERSARYTTAPPVVDESSSDATPRAFPSNPFAKRSSTENDKSALRYDGKTFDQWRSDWKIHSDSGATREDHVQMIRAFGAFAAAGYGEAADILLGHSLLPDQQIAQFARGQLKQLPEEDAKPLVPKLIDILETELSANRRIMAIAALAALGPNAEPALGILKKRLASDTPQERLFAAVAIKMMVGKDQYQLPLAEVLGKELGIRAVKTDTGAWAVVPTEDAPNDGKAFNDFNNAVIKAQDQIFLPDPTKSDE